MKKAVHLPRPKFLAQNISTKVCDSRYFLYYASIQSLPYIFHNEWKCILFGLNLSHISHNFWNFKLLVARLQLGDPLHFPQFDVMFASTLPFVFLHFCTRTRAFGHKISAIFEKFPRPWVAKVTTFFMSAKCWYSKWYLHRTGLERVWPLVCGMCHTCQYNFVFRTTLVFLTLVGNLLHFWILLDWTKTQIVLFKLS